MTEMINRELQYEEVWQRVDFQKTWNNNVIIN